MLSCNWEGTGAILRSCFLNPNIPGSVCIYYLQGVFAVIDSSHDIHVRTSLLMRGVDRLGFLWLSAGILGLQHGLLDLPRTRINKSELRSAAWTQTLHSFIQQSILGIHD